MRIENTDLQSRSVSGAGFGIASILPAPPVSGSRPHEAYQETAGSPLSETQLRYFEEILFDQLAELLNQAGGTITGLVDDEAQFADALDFASRESLRSTLLRIRDRESKLIRKIHLALGRIREGSFGTCENCGEEIGILRLKARPVTTLCIQCKRKMEKAERALG